MARRTERKVDIREMEVDDIPTVYRLGRQLFHSLEISTLYRTWDAYEVTTNFNQDPKLSLVAKAKEGRIVGFALGTTYEKESGEWKYGHLLWMGVRPKLQSRGVGSQLCREMERRMHREGARMVFMDVARSNIGAVKFFKRMGYGRPQAEVWMSKIIQRAGKRKEENRDKPSNPPRRRRIRKKLPKRSVRKKEHHVRSEK